MQGKGRLLVSLTYEQRSVHHAESEKHSTDYYSTSTEPKEWVKFSKKKEQLTSATNPY